MFRKVVFLIILVLPSILVLLNNGNQNLLTSKSEIKVDQITKILPLLHKNKDQYELFTKTSFIGVADAKDNSDVNPKSYAVIDYETGEIIAEKNIDIKLPVASVTKIMTAV